MLKGLQQALQHDWQQNPSLVIAETLGTAASVIAAVLLSFKLTGLIPVYFCWTAGSTLLTISSWQRKNTNLLLLMIFYTVMNTIGLWNYL
jgi:hypothetical protein